MFAPTLTISGSLDNELVDKLEVLESVELDSETNDSVVLVVVLVITLVGVFVTFDPTNINQSKNPNIISSNNSETISQILTFFFTGTEVTETGTTSVILSVGRV